MEFYIGDALRTDFTLLQHLEANIGKGWRCSEVGKTIPFCFCQNVFFEQASKLEEIIIGRPLH